MFWHRTKQYFWKWKNWICWKNKSFLGLGNGRRKIGKNFPFRSAPQPFTVPVKSEYISNRSAAPAYRKILESGTLQFESRTLCNGIFHRHFSSRTGAVCQGGSRAARTTLAAVTFLAQTAGKQTKKWIGSRKKQRRDKQTACAKTENKKINWRWKDEDWTRCNLYQN